MYLAIAIGVVMALSIALYVSPWYAAIEDRNARRLARWIDARINGGQS